MFWVDFVDKIWVEYIYVIGNVQNYQHIVVLIILYVSRKKGWNALQFRHLKRQNWNRNKTNNTYNKAISHRTDGVISRDSTQNRRGDITWFNTEQTGWYHVIQHRTDGVVSRDSTQNRRGDITWFNVHSISCWPSMI